MIRGAAARSLLAGLHPAEAAPRMLGARLRAFSPEGEVVARLVEVEAYSGDDDPGSHGSRGRTARNEPMFGEAGALYVYFTYGMHCCANVVVGPAGRSAGVLLRGARIDAGQDLARIRRAAARRPDAARVADAELARGPGNLARAFGMTLDDNGADACAEGEAGRGAARGFSLELLGDGEWQELEPRIRRSLRTGVAGPGGLPPFEWRWYVDGEAAVSRYQRHPSLRDCAARPR